MPRNTYSVDEKLERSFNKSHFKRLLVYIKMFRRNIAIAVFFMFLSSLATLSNPYIIKVIMDDYIPAENITGVIYSGVLMFIIWLVTVGCMKIRMYYTNQTGHRIIHRMRLDIFENIQKLSFDFFDSRPHGKILIRVVNYINSLADMFANGIVNLIGDVFILAISIVMMFVINIKLALVAMAGLPFLFLGIWALKQSQRKAWQTYSNKSSNLNAYIHESISGMRVTQSFAREDENLEIFKNVTNETKMSWYKASFVQFLMNPMVETISILTISAVYIAAIFWFNSGGGIEIGALIAFTTYISMFWKPINDMSNFYNMIITNAAYLERIFETMDEQPLIEDTPGAVELPPVTGSVEFKNVTFAYEEGHNIIENLSFAVRPGESIALVGQTGAGKTTVTSLISRFYDVTGGEVLIDGHNVKDVTLKSLRRQMGVMMQDSFIFSGNIIDNIRYGNYIASDEDVIAAAKAVCADEFISSLPGGYYTEVTERGSTLSAGQRQLISFARALLADPKILILDEATSSIDTMTEMALQRGLEILLAGRTSFIIAHRLSTVKTADKIMVIGKGGILECGTHGELLKLKGNYYDLYRAQYDFLEN